MLAKTDIFENRQVRLAELGKAISHPARIAILEILARRDTCICGDLVDELPLAQATVSRHLKTLKDARLIKGEVDGPRSCYCLDREVLAEVNVLLSNTFDTLLSAINNADCC